jgi:hypothetical protein
MNEWAWNGYDAAMNDTIKSRTRFYRLTPGRFVLALLAVEVLLWLSERFGWIGWHKGYAVLTGLAVVGVAMVLMGVWFAVALVFRQRFQFSLRSLLALVVVAALPCSWMAAEIKKAREQREAVEAVANLGGDWGYYQVGHFDGDSMTIIPPPEPARLRRMLGDDFFTDVSFVVFPSGTQATNSDLAHVTKLKHLKWLLIGDTQVTDAGLTRIAGLTQLRELMLACPQVTNDGLKHLSGLTKLRELDLADTKVTDEGVAKLQEALPNCKITRITH